MEGSQSKQRTRNYIQQLKGSFLFKILAVGASFLAIPLMIRYLGVESYGIWSTLLAIVSWIVFFDLGIGNGLRNKVAESLANNDLEEAHNYISSGYTLLGLVSVFLLVSLLSLSYFISWQGVFNTQSILEEDIRVAVQIMILTIIINFWLGLINPILHAKQKTSIVVLGQAIFNLIVLFALYVLFVVTEASLLYVAIIYGVSLVLANTMLTLWLFRKHKGLTPHFLWKRKYIKPLLTLGGGFFIIQLAVLVIFTTDKILITQLFGPEHVTPYDVVFKLFSIITIIYGVISAPLWSAYTDAYHRNDLLWIKRTLKQQLMIFIVIIGIVFLMIYMAKPVILVWIGSDVKVSFSLIVGIAIFIIVSVWNNVFSFVINGLGVIKIQIITASLGMLLNIPLSIVFVKFYGFGIEGVVWGTIISLLIFSVIAPFQVYKVINKKVLVSE